MTVDNNLKLFLDENLHLLQEDNINELYKKAVLSSLIQTRDLTMLCLELGVNPIDYFTVEVPQYCFHQINEDKIKNVTLLNSCYHIDQLAFSMSSVQKINLNNVQKVGRKAFYQTNIEEANFDKGVFIGTSSFQESSLKTVKFMNNVTISPSAFTNCTELETVEFNGDTVIGMRAFCGCTKLQNIDLTHVKQIMDTAFSRCDLRSVVIGEQCNMLGSNIFNGCNNLTDVTILTKDDIAIDMFVFGGAPNDIIVHCYEDSNVYEKLKHNSEVHIELL